MPPGVGQYATQQGQKLAVGLGSARTTKATRPFPGGHLRGRRDGIAAAAKKQSSPGWSQPCGFDGRARPMARPVAHDPWTGVGATHRRTAVRATPSGYPTRHTPRGAEGASTNPQADSRGLSDRSDVVRETAGLPSSRNDEAVSNDPTEESSPFRAGRTSSISRLSYPYLIRIR